MDSGQDIPLQSALESCKRTQYVALSVMWGKTVTFDRPCDGMAVHQLRVESYGPSTSSNIYSLATGVNWTEIMQQDVDLDKHL